MQAAIIKLLFFFLALTGCAADNDIPTPAKKTSSAESKEFGSGQETSIRSETSDSNISSQTSAAKEASSSPTPQASATPTSCGGYRSPQGGCWYKSNEHYSAGCGGICSSHNGISPFSAAAAGAGACGNILANLGIGETPSSGNSPGCSYSVWLGHGGASYLVCGCNN